MKTTIMMIQIRKVIIQYLKFLNSVGCALKICIFCSTTHTTSCFSYALMQKLLFCWSCAFMIKYLGGWNANGGGARLSILSRTLSGY